MRPYTSFVSNVLFPVHEWIKHHKSVAKLKELEISQWWDREKLEEYRVERLRTLLDHASTHVPYYRRVLRESGLRPREVTGLSDLSRLPLLTKPLIRAHGHDLVADNAGPIKRYGTSGSSGEPLVFFIGRDRITHDVAAKWRVTRWWNVDIGDKEIVFWASPIEVGAQDRIKAIRDRLIRTQLLPTSRMSDADLDRFLAKIRAFRPRMLFGYPFAMSRIADHSEKRGIRLDHLGIQVAFVTGEALYESQRECIERVFGCRVANGYGARDAGFIAHQCPQGSMHISAEDIVVEIVGSDGRVQPAGEAGEIVVTHLSTYDFPFIRYRTGDIGVLDDRDCECGRGLPIIKEIKGRSNDCVVTSDGSLVHSSAISSLFRDFVGIQQFRVTQCSLDRTNVQVVPGPGFQDGVLAVIETALKSRLGSSVQVLVEKVEDVPLEKTGKYRYIVSHVGAR